MGRYGEIWGDMGDAAGRRDVPMLSSRCRRDVAGMSQGCRRDTVEMQSRSSRDLAEICSGQALGETTRRLLRREGASFLWRDLAEIQPRGSGEAAER